MRKVNYLSVLAVLFALSANGQNVKFGIRGGLNFANIAKNEANNLHTRVGVNIGGFVDFKLSDHFSIQPGLQISTKGAKVNDYVFRSTYVEIPVYALYHCDLDKVKFFGGAGPYFALGVSGQELNGSTKQNIAWGETGAWHRADAGLGFILGVGFGPGLQAGVNYDLGLANIHKPFHGGDGLRAYNRVLGLFIGYTFNSGK